MRLPATLAMCLLAGACSTLLAQSRTVRFQHFAMDEGLSQRNALCLLQDRQGFLWIGTQDGLNRYDGFSFKHYKHRSNDSTSLSDDFVRTLYEDAAGTLWIGTWNGGLNRFDRKQETFVRYDFGDAREFLSGAVNPNQVTAIAEDEHGTLWLGTGAGVLRFDPATGAYRVQRFDDPALNDALQVKALLLDRRGRVWFGTEEGLAARFEPPPASDVLTNPVAAEVILSISHPVRALHEDDQQVLWIGTLGAGLYAADPASGPLTRYQPDPDDPYSLNDNRITALQTDRAGYLWVGTVDSGVSRFSKDSGRFVHFRNAQDALNSQVFDVLEDRTGVLWVGTWDGIYSLSPLYEAFRLYTDEPGRLSPSGVVALHEDRAGRLWLGTMRGGLNVLDRATNQFTHYQAGDRSGLSYNTIFGILEDERGTLWIATHGGGLNRLDRATNRFRPFHHDPNEPASLSDSTVTSVYLDRAGMLWMGTRYRGLNRLDRATGRFTRYQHRPHPDSLGSNYAWPIYEDHTGTLWVGTIEGGLHSLDRETGRFTRYTHDPTIPGSLSSNRVYVLGEDAGGTLWVGTTGGLNRFDRETQTFHTYTEADGLAHDHVAGLLVDDAGDLWLSTNNGLSRFDPRTETFTTYKARVGLQNNQFYVGSTHKNAKGELFFGGPGGFNIIDPKKIRATPLPPPVVLTDFTVHNKPFDLSQSATTVEEIVLNYDENFFSFTFAALDFTDVSQNRYAYKLEGLDRDWIDNGTSPTASYTSVPHGTYTLRVRAANNEGVWNEEGLALPITIHPPFWATWWFRILVILAVIGLLAAAYTYRVRQLLRVERMRLRIASALHDDIGANLSSIAIKSEMVHNLHDLDERGRRRLAEVTRAARESALKLREMVWVVNAEYDTFDKLITKMEDLTATMLEGYAHTFATHPQPPPTRPLHMEFRQHVYFLYKEALHNIVKHAAATRVDVAVTLRQGSLHLVVEDDGIGFDEAQVQAGHGLKSMRARAEAIGGRLEIHSHAGQGTRLTLIAKVA